MNTRTEEAFAHADGTILREDAEHLRFVYREEGARAAQLSAMRMAHRTVMVKRQSALNHLADTLGEEALTNFTQWGAADLLDTLSGATRRVGESDNAEEQEELLTICQGIEAELLRRLTA